MNPIIRKELRLHLRERRGWLLLTLYLLVLGGVVIFTYSQSMRGAVEFGPRVETSGAQLGEQVFLAVAFTQLALLLLLAPVYSAGRLTIEKEQQTMSGLLTSLLSTGQIWWGKYAASMLFLLLLFLSSLPVLGIAFALGGIGPSDLLRVAGMTLLILASICSVGLYCSSYFRRSLYSTAVCYGLIAVLTVLTAIVLAVADIDPTTTEEGARQYARVIIQLNPFYALATLVEPGALGKNEWIPCALLFASVGLIAVALSLRNLRRTEEQV